MAQELQNQPIIVLRVFRYQIKEMYGIGMEQANKMHHRMTDFFLTKNFKSFNEDVDKQKRHEMTDVQIQCLGYGIFKKKETLNNFFNYIIDLLRSRPKMMKGLKITLNGFNLEDLAKVQLFKSIAEEIMGVKQNLKLLWIHTANLSGTSIEDFEILLRLSYELADINFQDFSLQCANWKFLKMQPRFQDLSRIFTSLIKDCGDGGLKHIRNKNFRLQMSGWFYEITDAKNFLGFRPKNQDEIKKIPEANRQYYQQGNDYSEEDFSRELERYHNQMEILIKSLLQVMDEIQELQLDMRNTHDILKMKNLKKKLDNVTKENRYQKSIMSKKFDLQADEAEKELRLTIVM